MREEKELDICIKETQNELFEEFKKLHEKRLKEEGKPLWFTSFYLNKLRELCFSDEELIVLAALIELSMQIGRLQGISDFSIKMSEIKSREEGVGEKSPVIS